VHRPLGAGAAGRDLEELEMRVFIHPHEKKEKWSTKIADGGRTRGYILVDDLGWSEVRYA
jgi:hypothetical protein